MADLSRNRWPVIFGTGGRNSSEQVAEFIGIGTQYVRAEFVDETRQQIEVYKRFKKLIEKWIDLAIEHSQVKMKQAKRMKR